MKKLELKNWIGVLLAFSGLSTLLESEVNFIKFEPYLLEVLKSSDID